MIDRLRAPLKTGHLAALALGLSLAVTLYCLAYTALAGRSESPVEALAWTFANVLPWLAAFEAGKRCRRAAAKALVLAAALAVSLALGNKAGDGQSLGFEIVRRLPGLLIVAGLLAVAALPPRRRPGATAGPAELPIPPEEIDWIAAAGNYVELHGRGRVVLHRAPLSLIEAQLATRGFVRVHRSTLVRRDSIARIRPLDVVLRGGAVLKTGKRYRARLGQENFVPSSLSAGGPAAEAS